MKKSKKIKILKSAMREIYEVWAGSEGLVDTTASEAYQMMLIENMRDIAAMHMKRRSRENEKKY